MSGCDGYKVTNFCANFHIRGGMGLQLLNCPPPDFDEKGRIFNKLITKKIPSGGDGMDAGLPWKTEWNT